MDGAILEILEMLDFINSHGGFTEYNDYSELHDAVSLLPCNDWISVDDALPDEGQRVITCGVRGGIQICTYEGLLVDGIPFFRSATSRKYPPVTHWMPLPQPPEVKE